MQEFLLILALGIIVYIFILLCIRSCSKNGNRYKTNETTTVVTFNQSIMEPNTDPIIHGPAPVVHGAQPIPISGPTSRICSVSIHPSVQSSPHFDVTSTSHIRIPPTYPEQDAPPSYEEAMAISNRHESRHLNS